MRTELSIFIDTDVFVAFTKQDDSNHEKVKHLFNLLKERQVIFFTSNYVFFESITVISQRVSHAIAIKYIEAMKSQENPYIMERIDEGIEDAAIQIFKKQTSKNTSFVDCTNIALIHHLKADAIFSFDEVYRKNKLSLVSDLF